MKLANNIQTLRRSKNWSQEELAEKCGVSRQAVTKWETGESTPSIEKLCLMADLFGVSVDILLGRKSNNLKQRLQDILDEFAVEDVPATDDDDAGAMVIRFIQSMRQHGCTDEVICDTLCEIFLKEDSFSTK